MYNFDKIIDRRNTGSYKWDRLDTVFGDADLTALWVADMDWETPDFIRNAVREKLKDTLAMGYACDPADWWPTVIEWIKTHHQWEVKEEWLTYIPGIVRGIGFAINSLIDREAPVIVQPPVYHPFFLVPQGLGHEVLWNPLKQVCDEDGHLVSYEMDFDNLEKTFSNIYKGISPSSPNGIFILCNPHNPCGVCWDRDTLQRLALLAKKYNVVVLSDEIHCDMTIFGHKHIPFATVSDEAREVSITFSAPTKTFNMAGIVSSWCVVPNDRLREKYFRFLEASELNAAAMFAPVATTAALKNGETWRKEMLQYLEGNVDFVIDYCREHIRGVNPVRPDASFLVWLDCRELCKERLLSHSDITELFKKAGLALNSGAMFGKEGEGFMRLNVGCPRCILADALERLAEVCS